MPDLARPPLTTDRATTDWLTTDRATSNRATRKRFGPDRVRPDWLWLALAVGDNRGDRTPDPERAEPLLDLDVTCGAGHLVAELTRLGILTVIADRAVVPRLALSRLPPASAPPGHS